MNFKPYAKRLGAGLIVLTSLTLASCILLPGKFDSSLDLRSDGTFTFDYEGQMLFLPLSKEFGDRGVDGEVSTTEAVAEEYCYDDNTFDERECTAEELEEFKRQNAEARERSNQAARERNEQMAKMLGGVDPADPEAGQKFAAQLERQAGWDSVKYIGDGLFEVKYAISSRLTHDFAFPAIEGMNFIPPFVQMHRRDGGAIRINAPGYSAQAVTNGMNPALLMFGQSFGSAPTGNGKSEIDMANLVNGTFSITTDGEILANNTDQGPVDTETGRRLSWNVDASSTQAPTALIRIR